MTHPGKLRSVPSMIDKPDLSETNHKTTPLHLEGVEEENKHSVDGRDSITEENMELVSSKLQKIADSRKAEISEEYKNFVVEKW